MITVKGRFDGKVVVLTEPAPVDHEADVTVSFVDADLSLPDRFNWYLTRGIEDGYAGSVADEVVRQRRQD